MTDARPRGHQSRRGPPDLGDRTDIDCPDRLAPLQRWKAEPARTDAPQEERGAIDAPEMSAAVQHDDAEAISAGAAHREGPNG